MVCFKIYPIVSIGYNKLHLEPGVNHWPVSFCASLSEALMHASCISVFLLHVKAILISSLFQPQINEETSTPDASVGRKPLSLYL